MVFKRNLYFAAVWAAIFFAALGLNSVQADQTGDCTAGSQYCEQNSMETTSTTTTASSEQAPVEEDKNDEPKDISFYQEELKKMEVDRQLTNAARLQAEAMVTKLKKELINAKELAQKEARIAKNAMTLLRQAEEKLKKLS